jgi:brefeldin A-resistance guanine nucleotide exchange factor 1
LLRVLIALLNPSDQAHTDSMRLCALAILNTALEVGGVTLGKWPELREGLRDEGCRYLFQVSFTFHQLVPVTKLMCRSLQGPTRRHSCHHRSARHPPCLQHSCHTSSFNLNCSSRT